ncbi:MAG: hypothetical protein ABW061_28435 [Polyangiaceae bacterium]
MENIEMVGSGVISAWGKRIAALVLFGTALGSWSCSSGSPSPSAANGDIPPPLNQPCNTDNDCGTSGLKCDPLRGCLPCVFDWHCAKGERCTDDGCKVPSPCTSDDNCSDKPKAPHCDPVLGECVGCRTESDCPSKSHCIERNCVSYTPCVNSRDCAEGTVCDRDKGECTECLGNGDCEKDKEVCVASHCVPVCTSDKDCAARNQLCHHDTGYCADCVEQEDCPSIYYCDHDQCKLDVCKPGDTICQGGIGGYAVCNSAGSGYEQRSCPVSTSCSIEGVAGCKPWLCTPGTSDCSANGKTVKQCAMDGLSFASEVDCDADGEVCYLAQCKPKVCDPGSTFCQGAQVRECAANGSDSTVKSECGVGKYCDSASLSCVNQKCAPGAAVCDGSVATHCDAIGSGPVAGGAKCSADGRVCLNGECREVICDGPFCKDGNAWSCNESGTSSQLNTTCPTSSYCLNGACQVDQCTPGYTLCSGNTATTCKADGSGPASGGTDCGATGKVCDNGNCVAKVCDPYSYFCVAGNPQHCNSIGSAATQSDTCGASYYCQAGSSYCQSDVCTAGQKICTGTVAASCAADGSGPDANGTDCATDGKVCYLGSCLPKVCNPNEYFCQAGNSYTCGSTGATSTLNDTCLSSEYCKPGSYSCQVDVCTAAAPTCNGANLSTCAADGSGPIDAGTSCGTGNTCVAGACKPVICTLDALRCSGGNIQRCTDSGTAWSAYQSCGTTTYCNELATPIVCAPDICTPGGNACDGEKVATCATDGGHFTVSGTNCAASNMVCTLDNTCAAVAVDTTAGATTYSMSSSLVGNIYRLDRSRTLTKIEEYLSVSGTSVFTWVVYESTTVSGTFTKVYEQTTSDSGAGAYISSGALSVPLTAGKFYLLGVIVQGSFTRYANTTGLQPFLSFGQLDYSLQVSTSTAPATVYGTNISYQLNTQRISTAP